MKQFSCSAGPGCCQLALSLLLAVFAAPLTLAQLSPLSSAPEQGYYYIDHYDVVINKPVAEVWPQVVDLGSWMQGLAEANTSPPMAVEGAVIHLYENFYVEVAKVLPEQLIVLVNLPTSQEGEATHGIAMISLAPAPEGTLVSLFMNRIYFWFEDQPNVLRQRRASLAFADARRATYQDGYLGTLKALAESGVASSTAP